MPVVTGTLVEPDGSLMPSARVEFTLVDAAGDELRRGWLTASDRTIVGRSVVQTDASGVYIVTLPGNDDVTPADTRWRRRVFPADGSAPPAADLLLVPSSGGPYNEDELIIDAIPVVDPLGTARGVLSRWRLSGADNSSVQTASTSMTALAGLGGTITVTDRPISVHLLVDWCAVSASGRTGEFRVMVDGAEVTSRTVLWPSGGTQPRLHVDLWWTPDTPLAAGDHTVAVEWRAGQSGTTFVAYPNGLDLSAFGLRNYPTSVVCEAIEW